MSMGSTVYNAFIATRACAIAELLRLNILHTQSNLPVAYRVPGVSRSRIHIGQRFESSSHIYCESRNSLRNAFRRSFVIRLPDVHRPLTAGIGVEGCAVGDSPLQIVHAHSNAQRTFGPIGKVKETQTD